MTQHTPGPWKNNNGHIRPAQGKGRTGGYAPLIKIHGDKRITNDEINAANARLIAASPDLLEALTNIAENSTDSGAIECAREAIAKAIGGAV